MSRSEHAPPTAATPPGTGQAPAIAGAHRVLPRTHRRTSATLGRQPPTRYAPYLDGLFTYCLSVLCDHDSATAALGDALAVADRNHGRLQDRTRRRAWLYALARWACLRRLARQPRTLDSLAATARPERSPRAAAGERRRQLGALAWPEAAGTTPEQREVLELALRHQLSEREIAAVLGMDVPAVQRLLSRAACEVERTSTALAVIGVGGCPAVARLAGDAQVLLSSGLRRELVRHVDDCPACRLAAEQVIARGPWPGTITPATLAIVEAPAGAVHAAMLHALAEQRAGSRDRRGAALRSSPHFDRRGFPVDARRRAARRAAARHRALTGTVVAAVVATPALALWAAYRSAPHTGDGEGNAVTAADARGGRSTAYERTGGNGASHTPRAARSRSGSFGDTYTDDDPDEGPSAVPAEPAASPGPASPRAAAPSHGPGWITVSAQPQGDTTVITLTASGGSPVHWTAATGAGWLHLSAASGVLRPGESASITVLVDHAAEPAGPWRAAVAIEPGGSVVTIEGTGRNPSPSGSPPPSPSATASARPSPSPS